MDELLGSPIPEEGQATCDDCAMQPAPGALPDASSVYFGAAKCCTFHPTLHNFLAGAALSDPGCEGRPALERLLAARAGVTPLAIAAPPAYWLLYGASPGAFGRSEKLRCQLYLDDGRCGVWQHRESTCATWFCKHDRGAVGESFWSALRSLLAIVERGVARHCMLELGIEDEALTALLSGSGELTAEELDGGVDDGRYRALWGHFEGREREFFASCAGIAAALRWPDVLALAGSEGRALGQIARAAHARLGRTALPLVPLRLGKFQVATASSESVRLVTYRAYDPIDVPPALFAALRRFDGRPTAAVLAEIAAEERIDLRPEQVRTLADFEVLI